MSPEAAVLGTRTVPGRPEFVAEAREFVAGMLGGEDGDCGDTAALLTSELVTNAVVHTDSGSEGGKVTIVVATMAPGIVVEVTDDGSPHSAPVVTRDPYAADGRGLLLVQELSSRWGYWRDLTGTTVWFRIDGAAGRCRAIPDLAAASPPNRRAVTPPYDMRPAAGEHDRDTERMAAARGCNADAPLRGRVITAPFGGIWP